MRRWALVTAGAQGLGGALSRRLLEQGFGVVVHYHSSSAGADTLKARFGEEQVISAAADLANKDDRVNLIDTVRQHVQQLDVLVNNLGVYPEVPLLETSIDLWDKTFNLTCTAAFHLIQELHGLMPGGGRIVNIGDSSIDRLEGHTSATPYYVGKYGLHVLTRSYAPLLAPRGITVNMISPGWLENSLGPSNPDLPAGRRGTFEDITGALDYLLSEAADHVSGTNLIVSGGFNLTRGLAEFEIEDRATSDQVEP